MAEVKCCKLDDDFNLLNLSFTDTLYDARSKVIKCIVDIQVSLPYIACKRRNNQFSLNGWDRKRKSWGWRIFSINVFEERLTMVMVFCNSAVTDSAHWALEDVLAMKRIFSSDLLYPLLSNLTIQSNCIMKGLSLNNLSSTLGELALK